MPFVSKSQQRFMFATNPEVAKRWARHTPDMKKLPEKKPADADKKAFAAAFILKCAAAGITSPAAVAAAAMQVKAASGAGTAAQALGQLGGLWPLTATLGSVAAPMAVGGFGGALLAGAANKTDEDDAKTLRYSAEANAYRRRAAQLAAHAEVRKLIASDPKKYVVLG